MKLAKSHAEKTKVNIRKARQKAIADLRGVDDVSKDAVHRLEKHVNDPIAGCKGVTCHWANSCRS